MARWFRRWHARVALAALMTLVGSLLVVVPACADTAWAMRTYVVLYKDGASSASAATAVRQAGGTLIWNYPDIGVVIARSSSTSFKGAMQAAAGVEGVAATSGFATRMKDDQADDTERTGHKLRPSLGASVGHGPDPGARGPRSHWRQSVGGGR